mmetsp:Transcript_70240/g.165312  ORF Transcript_70240/g.165312 Transcript_70240/m.165312 type:complete len:407 (+) Transcript_70240:1119-2339(+)
MPLSSVLSSPERRVVAASRARFLFFPNAQSTAESFRGLTCPFMAATNVPLYLVRAAWSLCSRMPSGLREAMSASSWCSVSMTVHLTVSSATSDGPSLLLGASATHTRSHCSPKMWYTRMSLSSPNGRRRAAPTRSLRAVNFLSRLSRVVTLAFCSVSRSHRFFLSSLSTSSVPATAGVSVTLSLSLAFSVLFCVVFVAATISALGPQPNHGGGSGLVFGVAGVSSALGVATVSSTLGVASSTVALVSLVALPSPTSTCIGSGASAAEPSAWLSALSSSLTSASEGRVFSGVLLSLIRASSGSSSPSRAALSLAAMAAEYSARLRVARRSNASREASMCDRVAPHSMTSSPSKMNTCTRSSRDISAHGEPSASVTRSRCRTLAFTALSASASASASTSALGAEGAAI